MNDDLKKIDFYVAAIGALTTCLAGFFWNAHIFLGALAGSVLAILNWIGFRYLVSRLIEGRNRTRAGLLLALKFLAILAAVSVVLLTVPINVIAFIMGISSLFLGIVTHAVCQALRPDSAALEEDS